MRKLFGTDGIRGLANKEPMTPETMVRVGRAAACILKSTSTRPRIVIGKDTRLHGYMLESALTAGITSMGVDALLLGPLPTPGIAFITRSLRADAGIMISASHNPFKDNGIKFFNQQGLKLPDTVEEEIETLLFSGRIDKIRPNAKEVGKAYRVVDAAGRYIEFAKNTVPKGISLKGLKLVVDCANGAAYKVSPTVLRELGAEVIPLNIQPDGTNINKGCGSLHPEMMRRAVRKYGADAGFAHDGDGDRVVFADERGELLDGDVLLAICALNLSKDGRLPGRTIVATVMSNLGLDLCLREAGIRVARTAVGDRYVLEEMLKHGYVLGGEQSGHLIFLEHNTTGDGIVTALQVLAIVKKEGKRLSELRACMKPCPQALISVRVKRRDDFEDLPLLRAKIREAEAKLNGSGRVLVRYSGTEPFARVMVEGSDRRLVEHLAREIAMAIQKELG